MKKILMGLLGIVCCGSVYATVLSDKEVRQAMIAGSIGSYPGKCACPYSLMNSGRACGGRSAYSKMGGYETLCYEKDISDELLNRYKIIHGLQ